MAITLNNILKTGLMALPLVLVASGAMAAENAGQMADRLSEQLEPISKLISIISFVAGLGIGMSGILKLKAHSQNPAQVPLSQPMFRILVGAGLIALPTALGNGIMTFFGDDTQRVTATDGVTSID